MMRHRAGRLAAGMAALIAVATAGVTVSQAAPLTSRPAAQTLARAADPVGGIVPVNLAALSPVVPALGDTLTIRGTVINNAATTVRGVDVRLRVSPTPVRDRSEIPQILAGDAGRTGIAVEASRVSVAATLAPGEQAAFTMSVPLTALNLTSSTPEVVVLGMESLGNIDDDGQGTIQTGLTRTFLPWFPDPSLVTPTPVVWLFPLTSAPSRAGNGVFLDDHLATEVGAHGRLSNLLAAAESAPSAVSWVVDPALLQSLADMSDGYSVRSPDGTLAQGTGVQDAANWLARLQILTASSEVTASAYADPDVVALHRAGLDVDIALAATTARELPSSLLTAPIGSGLAWPAGQVTDDGTLDVLRASGARVVVLTATALPPSPAINYTPSGSVDLATGGSPLRAAVSDPDLSRLVAAPGRKTTDAATASPITRRQTALAELAMTTLELPNTPRTLVIAPDTRWSAYGATTQDLISTLAASPWARPERLATLLALPASDAPRARTDYPAAARTAELSASFRAAVSRGRADLAALRAVAPDTVGTSTGDLEEALTRTESSAWRTYPAGGRALLTSATSQIADQTRLIRILSRAPVTLPGDSGKIPVTVANDLDRPARVGVRLVGTPAIRFEADDVETVTLAPGQKLTLEVNARVLGTGPVVVDIVLLTPEGMPFGSPVRTEVRSAAYARAAQWVVIGLFGMLVILLGVNFVRRRRPARAVAAPTDANPTGDDEQREEVGRDGAP